MSERIKGQEVSIQVVVDTNPVEEFTEIMDFEATYEYEIIQQGYLGRKADSVDYIFKVISGKFSGHIHSSKVFDFLQSIKDKAQRKTPDTVFNLVGVFQFPSKGEIRSMTIPDVAWGNVPVNVGSRGDYVKLDFTFKAEDMLSVDE